MPTLSLVFRHAAGATMLRRRSASATVEVVTHRDRRRPCREPRVAQATAEFSSACAGFSGSVRCRFASRRLEPTFLLRRSRKLPTLSRARLLPSVYTCGPDDDIQAALHTMKQYCVRRLPVEGFGGIIMGIVSMNDIVLAAGPRKPVREAEVVGTLRAICAHHHPSPHIAAA